MRFQQLLQENRAFDDISHTKCQGGSSLAVFFELLKALALLVPASDVRVLVEVVAELDEGGHACQSEEVSDGEAVTGDPLRVLEELLNNQQGVLDVVTRLLRDVFHSVVQRRALEKKLLINKFKQF